MITSVTMRAGAGPQVSETIALAWEDVELVQGTVSFRRSKVRGAYRVTKTRRPTRKVRLLKPAWDALRKIDALNRNKKSERSISLRGTITQCGKPNCTSSS